MQLSDLRKLFLGLNCDDDPSLLTQGEFVDAINTRVASSSQQHGIGVKETLQSEVEVLINVNAEIYYGGAIGGEFIYSGYEEVTIGSQTWMKRNWDVNYPGSKVYGNVEANRTIYGGLYTYNHVIAEDFCPIGWHVPTEAEINTLLTYLGGILVAGGKMKEPDVLHWNAPNTGADDSSGFKGLPGGKYDNIFDLLGEMGLFWVVGEGYPWAPVALPATDITPITFMANWEASDGADGYWLDVATDIDFTSFVAGYQNKDVGNVLSDTIAGLIPSATYYYRVRASNDIDVSGNSNIITAKTADIIADLVDKDGNIYTTIIIGTQQWIIENFKTTHYADGIAIPNITTGLTGPELITDWTNSIAPFDYDTFVSVVNNITSAIDDGVGWQKNARTNMFTASAGETICLTLNFTNNVVGKPDLHFFCTTGSFYSGEEILFTDGLNNINILATEDYTDCYFMFETPVDTVPLNFSASFSVKISDTWQTDTTGAYCWYDNDIVNKTIYGALYNWHAVNNAHGLAYLERGGVQEIGWKVPTENDYITLRNYLGGILVAGGKLKETGLIHWTTPNTGATNESGFIGLPAGIRSPVNGLFYYLGTANYLWTSVEINALQASIVALLHDSGMFSCGGYFNLKTMGSSVRLVRDIGGGVSWDSTLITFDSTIITFDST